MGSSKDTFALILTELHGMLPRVNKDCKDGVEDTYTIAMNLSSNTFSSLHVTRDLVF